MKITRIEFDLARTDGALYRRQVDGRWEKSVCDAWVPVTERELVRLENQYMQEKKPARPPLGQMTEEHIVSLARHQLDLGPGEGIIVDRGDGWVRLYHGQGDVLVNNDMVVFSTGQHDPQPINAQVHLLRLVASWGYDVMMEES